ncbi:unnamed protein product [Effrenium voratum]|uniref:Methyltransferase FkbM domain-containing protein n=1 Tax=Effrenium voratum TaxID=2562239 RepID=A0AA36ILH2_9DINO|nr:unnamed protein product [Effrenium voratum]
MILPWWAVPVVHGLSSGWREDADGIYAEIQVAALPFDKNFAKVKDGKVRRFWLEVGAHRFQNVQDYPEFNEGDFVLSFEPLLDKYAYLLDRQPGTWNVRKGLGFQHERGLVFPFAVGCKGQATLAVAEHDMCSSVLPMAADSFPEGQDETFGVRDFKGRCATAAEKRLVPCISLEHVIRSWLGGSEVYYLKVDAQGSDLAVVKSAGRMLRRIQRVQLELACDFAASAYLQAPNCSEAVRFMRRQGYRCVFWDEEGQHDCGEPGASSSICQTCAAEIDLFFARVDPR